jgi:glycine dehydrogenase subunit 1
MRYLPLSDDDRRDMLASMGVGSVDDLFRDVPPAARLTGPLDLPRHQGELEVQRHMEALAAKNVSAGSVPFFVGAGAYRHHIPASVQHLMQRGEFLTAYTPYQPEISQGTLQYLFEFQTQVARLTGMEVANASMYDGSTGCGEAVLMAQRITKRVKVVLSGNLHPHYADVVETLTRFAPEEETVIRRAPAPQGGEDLIGLIDENTSCVVVQNPDFFGRIKDLSGLAAATHEAGALLVVVVTEAVSLGAVKSPGEMGADIVVGEGQSIGNSLNFGGPYLGLFATRQKYVRQMPGRLCGETVDAEGRRGFVLTLSTREQHIRREKATSNICTNSGLCALAFTMHMTLLGEKGLRRLAMLNHAKAVKAAGVLARVPGVEVLNEAFFNEFTIRVPRPAAQVIELLAQHKVLGGVPVSRFHRDHDDLIVVAVTETNTDQDIATFGAVLTEVLK